MKIGETITIQYWPRFKPIPVGWEKIVDFGENSHLWRAILIKEAAVKKKIRITPLSETCGHLTLAIDAKVLLQHMESIEHLILNSMNQDLRKKYIALMHTVAEALAEARKSSN